MQPEASEANVEAAASRRQGQLLAAIAALTLASGLYRFLVANRLEQTSALFIGVPALLAVVLTLAPRARTSQGMVLRVTTLGLLMSGIVLGEGFVCIVVSAPLFYVVALMVSWLLGWGQSAENGDVRTLRSVALLPLIPFLLEGVVPGWSFDREEVVAVERSVPASPAAVEAALAAVPAFDGPLPLFLRLGFPRPLATSGSGLAIGDRRRVLMGGGEGEPGVVEAVVVARRPGFVRMAIPSDASHVAHWLQWQDATIEWWPAPGGTRVRWTLRYRRDLDPAWYFGPLERYAVGLAAGHLIDQLATPRDVR